MPRRRNKRPDLSGVLVIDKGYGLSSTSVVTVVRGKSGGAKVGHAGTLDPLATGVLILCLGAATKATPTIMGMPKRYTADIDLSAFSTTDDMEGDPIPAPAPERAPTVVRVRAVLAGLVGIVMQRPPIHSAVMIGGRRAYTLARRGALSDTLSGTAEVGSASLLPRPVRIDSIDVLAYEFPRLLIDVRCGKGTYIRSLAREIGVRLGVGGRLTGLRRTEVGPYRADDAWRLEAVPDGFGPEALLPAPESPPDEVQAG